MMTNYDDDDHVAIQDQIEDVAIVTKVTMEEELLAFGGGVQRLLREVQRQEVVVLIDQRGYYKKLLRRS